MARHPLHEQVFTLALAGQGVRSIAATIGRSTRTVYRVLAQLRDDLAAARTEQLQAVRAQLTREAENAVTTLGRIVADPTASPAVRVQAALGILAHLRAYHESVQTDEIVLDLRRRLEALEKTIAEGARWPRGVRWNGSSSNSKQQSMSPTSSTPSRRHSLTNLVNQDSESPKGPTV